VDKARSGREPVERAASVGRQPAEPVEVLVGVVGRAHGIRGEVAIDLRTDEPARRFAAGSILRGDDTTRTFRVVSSLLHGGRWLLAFAELSDRTAAEQARGIRLVTDVDPTERPADPEEYFDRQLVGLTVLAHDGADLGRVTGVLHHPGQDLLEVQGDQARHLIPFVSAIVPGVDLAAGTLRLANVPGLLGEDSDAESIVDS
jgi:16S rRNA processing protein RimM